MLKMLLIGLTYWFFWPSILCFGLTLFRFKLKPLIPHIAYTSIAMTCVSIFLQTTKFVYFMSICQFVGFVLCLFLIFRIPLLYSFILMIFDYSVMLISEGAMNFLFPSTRITIITEENMVKFFLTGIAFSFVPLFLTLFLQKTRLGFSYIQRRLKPSQFIYHGTTAFNLVLIVSFIVMFIDSLGYFLFPDSLGPINFVLLLIVGTLLRISYRWDMAD